MDVPYISMQSNKKYPSPNFFNKIFCKTMKIDFKNLLRMEFCFFDAAFNYFKLSKDPKLIIEKNVHLEIIQNIRKSIQNM